MKSILHPSRCFSNVGQLQALFDTMVPCVADTSDTCTIIATCTADEQDQWPYDGKLFTDLI